MPLVPVPDLTRLLPVRQVTMIVIHCSASPWGDVDEIRKWHTDPPPRGRGWQDIGYHYVVGNGYATHAAYKAGTPDPEADGAVWPGRDLDHDGDVEEEIGAHTPGVNRTSIGVCLVGPHFTDKQIAQAAWFVAELCRKYRLKASDVKGHREFPSGAHKACPVTDMDVFRARVGALLGG